MHREPGFHRFFICYALFLLGMVVTSLAGTIETLFTGWEFVGLSSALLVAFFLERPAPVRNGLYVWTVYRVSDAALLIATVVMHHLTGEGDFDQLLGTGSWPGGEATRHLAPGAGRRIAAAGCRGRQIGVGAVFRLVAAGDGRTNSLQRRLLRRTVGPPGGIFAAAGQPDSRRLLLAQRRRDGGRGDYRLVCRLHRPRTNRHQMRPDLRLADTSRLYRRRNRARFPLHSADPYPGAWLFAHPPVPARADAFARLPDHGKCHRRPAAADARLLGAGHPALAQRLVLPAGPRARLSRRLAPGRRGQTVLGSAAVVRRSRATLDRFPFRRTVPRVGTQPPGASTFDELL